MNIRVASFLVLVLVAALARLIPHPPNFSPLLAVAIFAGAKAPARWMAFVAPVVALLFSDFMLGLPPHNLMWLVGICLGVSAVLGMIAEKSTSEKSILSKVLGFGIAGLLGPVFFFIVTNFAVWKTTDIYPHTT